MPGKVNRPSNPYRHGAIGTTIRAAARFVSPRAVKGLAREATGLATHLALYPLGLREPGVETAIAHTGAGHDTPVVLVHGYFHNRSGFFFLSRALRRSGFRWVYGMNYNPMGASIPSLAAQLADHVDDVRRVSGAGRVHIVGHSLGGLVARYYIQELGGEESVDHCVTIGTPHHGTYAAYGGLGRAAREMRPGSSLLVRLNARLHRCTTRFINLYSDLDVLIIPPEAAMLPEGPLVENHLIGDYGHTSLLVSSEMIDTVTGHLAGAEPIEQMAEVRRLPVRLAADGRSLSRPS